MDNQEEIIKKVEIVLNARLGAIIAGSILKNNLSKLGKDVKNLTKEDCKTLIENIASSVSLLGTKDESKPIRSDLENLFKKYF